MVDKNKAYTPQPYIRDSRRRVRITKDMIMRFGFTQKRQGCTANNIGIAKQPHHEACHARIENELRKEGNLNLQRADERVQDHFAEKIRKSIETEGDDQLATPGRKHVRFVHDAEVSQGNVSSSGSSSSGVQQQQQQQQQQQEHQQQQQQELDVDLPPPSVDEEMEENINWNKYEEENKGV